MPLILLRSACGHLCKTLIKELVLLSCSLSAEHILWGHEDKRAVLQCLLLFFSCSGVSDCLWPHGLQHARLSCPSPSPGSCSNSCPLSRWCHPTISSSVVPSSFCSQSFPASGSFLMSRLFTSGGQSIGASASASLLLVNIQDWSPLGLAGLISLQFKGLSVLIHSNQWTTDQQEWSLVSSLWWKN